MTKITFTRARFAAFSFILLSFIPVAWGSQSITLGWNASTDAAVVGSVVYYGTASGNYDSRLDVGANTTVAVTNLQEGLTYYFAITDYDSQHNESAPSGEISYLVPGILRLQAGALAGGAMLLTFPVAPSHWYEIQASTNLTSWTTIGSTPVATSNAWTGFTDFEGSALPQRFYRLCMH